VLLLLLLPAVVTGEPHRERARAEQIYQAARALERAGQRSSALERYLQALLVGPGLHAGAAERLARDPAFPLSASGLRVLAARDLSTLDPRLRSGIRHRVALFWLRSGEVARARAVLVLEDRPWAHYLLALIALREGKTDAARHQLELARGGGDRDIAELCTLALARLDVETGDLKRAERRYLGVAFGSPHFFRSRQELAWLYLRRSMPAQALAQSVSLAAPSLARHYRPDRELVEAAALSSLCRVKQALGLARRGAARLDSDIKKTRKFLRPRPDARLYYVEAMASVVRGGGTLPGVGALLGDSGFRRVFQTVWQLQRERSLLLRTGAAGLRHELSSELDLRLVQAQQRAGRTVVSIFTRLLVELEDLRLRAQELLVDLEGQAVQAVIRRREHRSPPREGSRPIAGRGQQQWPFLGEYWVDEVGRYQVELGGSSCH